MPSHFSFAMSDGSCLLTLSFKEVWYISSCLSPRFSLIQKLEYAKSTPNCVPQAFYFYELYTTATEHLVVKGLIQHYLTFYGNFCDVLLKSYATTNKNIDFAMPTTTGIVDQHAIFGNNHIPHQIIHTFVEPIISKSHGFSALLHSNLQNHTSNKPIRVYDIGSHTNVTSTNTINNK